MVLDAFNCGFVVCYEDGQVAGSKHVGSLLCFLC